MNLKTFDDSKIKNLQDQYSDEASERWGNTQEYKQSRKKTAKYSKEDWSKVQNEANDIYSKLADSMDKDPACDDVQGLIKQWQEHISKYYYECSNEVLRELGKMYVSDERFTKNIDRTKEGLAEFLSGAISIYTK